MSIKLNHLIIYCLDADITSSFLTGILGLPNPKRVDPFKAVKLANDVTLDFYGTGEKVSPQHYAFTVSGNEFDAIMARIQKSGISYWADPFHNLKNQINIDRGERGFYFEDPNGHNMEILTISQL